MTSRSACFGGSPYGAMELKLVSNRYWSYGLVTSFLFHLAIIGVYFLLGPTEPRGDGWDGRPRGPEQYREFDITAYSPSPGIPAPRMPSREGKKIIERARPVPVTETSPVAHREVDPWPEIPHEYPVPGENGGLGGEPTRGGIPPSIDFPDDVEPDTFVAEEKHPVVIKSVKPVYPEIPLRAGVEGKVWVRIWVDKHGSVRDARVVKSTNALFEQAALDAARAFLFTPAYMNSGPVAVWVAVPFTFTLVHK